MYYRWCLYASIRRVARIWKRGGGAAFLKEWEKCKQPWPEFSLFLNESVSHGLSENWDEISRKARKFKRFFSPKTGGLQKKKVFTKIESDFLAKIGNSNVFSAQKQVVSKKKKKGLHRSWVWFFGQNRKFKRFFTPNHNIYFTTSAPNFLWGGGAVFNFSPKIGLKSNKNLRFCILHKPMGGLEPPAPPGYATG